MADFARRKTSYRKLKVFQKAEAVYDLTYSFLQKHIAKSDRTYDQMLQAARSGKQNIVEGRSDATISAEIEIRLFGVAYGSFDELLNDYEDYMRTREITIWQPGYGRLSRLREFCKNHNSTNDYKPLIHKMDDEEYCNLMLTLIHQTMGMLSSMIDKIKEDFLKNGGIKEQMYKARIDRRNDNKK